MTKPDKVLISVILVLALFSYGIYFLFNREAAPLIAEILVNGNTVTKIDLNTLSSDRLINVSGPLGTSIAEVKPGSIRMKYSPCPDRYCMETGWISRPGQVIVCVPNHIIIRINSDTDTVEKISH